MNSRLGMMVTCNGEFPLIKLHDPSNRYFGEVTWQIKCLTYPLAHDQYPPIWSGGDLPWEASTYIFACGHMKPPEKTKISTLSKCL